jgi:hypothetical protein
MRRRTTDPPIRLPTIMRSAPQLDIRDGRLATVRVRHDVMEFQEAGLTTSPLFTPKSTASAVARSDRFDENDCRVCGVVIFHVYHVKSDGRIGSTARDDARDHGFPAWRHQMRCAGVVIDFSGGLSEDNSADPQARS